MPVTFGCSLPSRGAMASPDNLRRLAQRAEDLSFDHVWVSDHIVIPHEVDSFYPYAADGVAPFQRDNTYFEPLAALNFLAGCTTRVKLGTHVLILPYRNPVLTAKILATLDVLSGGRLILGAGVGWMEEEFQAMGLDTYAQRGEVTNEYIQIFKELWDVRPARISRQALRHQRRWIPAQARAATTPTHLDRRPHQPGHPPGGHPGRRVDAHRVASAGHLEPEELSRKIANCAATSVRAGRAEDAVDLVFSTDCVFLNDTGDDRRLVSGRPEQIAADLRQYQDLGVTHFIFSFPATTADEQQHAMERFARK